MRWPPDPRLGARAACAAVALTLLAGCAPSGVRLPREPWPERLSEWRLFEGDLARLEPAPGVLVYDLNTPLFSDYALKHRTIWMPPGRSASVDGPGLLGLPPGTVLSKTFYYFRGGAPDTVTDLATPDAERLLIETRLLVHADEGWVALPYVWNAEQSEATLEIAGDQTRLVFAREGHEPRTFEYLVPNVDQCASCHVSHEGAGAPLRPIGPTLRNLARPSPRDPARSQLAVWSEQGYLAREPPTPEPLPVWDDAGTGDLDARARAYLDVQCAHCHGRAGPADTSGLYLGYDETDPLRLGVCKTPVAAGRGSGGLRYDVVPGRPDESILLFRMASPEPDVAMPELGRALAHEEGLALVREWIASLPGSCEPGASPS